MSDMNAKKNAVITAALACAALFVFCAASAELPAQTPPPPNLAAALARPIVTVMDKTDTHITGKHDYVSYAPYYWPDSSRPGGLPYVLRDGDENQAQIARGDRERIQTFFDTVEILASAWIANNNAAAARRAGEWLRAWFVSPATRMNPNLNYAQIRLGIDDNRGTPGGVIDARDLGRVVDSIKALENSPGLRDVDKGAIRAWFDIYLDWLLVSKIGSAERAAGNHHTTWFIAQALPIAAYLGRDNLILAFTEEIKKNMARQIARDGSQPAELRNVNSLSASVSNLEAFARVARYTAPLGVDLWNYVSASRSSLSGAVDFLTPYNNDPSKWTLSQKERLHPGFLDALIKERDAMVKPDSPARRNIAASPASVTSLPSVSALPPPPAYEPAPAFGPASMSEPEPVIAFGSAPAPMPASPSPEPGAAVAVARQIEPAVSAPFITSIVVVIQRDGSITFNGQEVFEEQFAQQLSQARAASRNIPVFISMNEAAPIKTLAAVMEACRGAGFNRISIQTQ